MTATEPIYRIKFAEKEVERYREDVEDWEKKHEQLKEICWAWEDLIAKANFLFGRLVSLESDVQHDILTGKLKNGGPLQEDIHTVLRIWLDVSKHLRRGIDRLKQEYGNVDGEEELIQNIRKAESALTPDDDFFRGDKLDGLRDQAVEEHRGGATTPLLEDEPIA